MRGTEFNWPSNPEKKHSKRISLTKGKFLLIVFLQLSVGSLYAQFYEYGQDAASLKWNHFKSEHYQLIYPQGLDSLAISFAGKLEYFYPYQAEKLQYKHQEMPVVIHNESSFSNGVFVWAPKRLEVFSNPDPNGYPQDWMTQLAVHEGRHAVQVSKLNQGFSKGLSYIFGEQSVGAITGFLPMWYLEGDAVDAETRFSYTGRGRLPSFEMEMKTILLEENEYAFSKALLGSYKSYIPNHYKLGYLMVHYGRSTYGDALWNDMEDYVAKKPWSIFPTYFSMKKYGIKSKTSFYSDAMDYYGDHWRTTLQEREIVEGKKWNKEEKKLYTNYRFPQCIDDSTLVALKSGIDIIPEFVLLNSSGEEKRIFRPGYMNSGKFSYSKGKMVWDELVQDIRWSNRNYSQLRIYDLETKSLEKIGTKTRYFAPALSHSGEQIVAVEQNTDQSFYLVIMDLKGRVLSKKKSPQNSFIQHPTWMEGDSAIVLVQLTDDGESLISYHLEGDSWRTLYSSGYNDISHPIVHENAIYFGNTMSGIDNIYCYRLDTDSVYKVSAAKFGAFDADVSADGSNLIFADYHVKGYDVVSIPLAEVGDEPFDVNFKRTEQIDFYPTKEETDIVEGSMAIQDSLYEVKPYRKLAHAINVHSWLPLYFDYMNPEAALTPGELPVSPGVSILTQNLLSTVTGMVGYEYKHKQHYLHSGFRLKGRVPVLDVSIERGGYPTVSKINEEDELTLQLNRFQFNSNLYVPLRFNTGKFISYAQPMFAYSYSSDVYPNKDRDAYEAGRNTFLFRLYLGSYMRTAKRDILPRLGFSAFISTRISPFEAHNFGTLKYHGANIYLPGPLKHQTIKVSLKSHLQEGGNYYSLNSAMNPRGLSDPIYGRDLKGISIDYTFPIAYPDLNIESIFYLKRIRANLWADYLRGIDVKDGGSTLVDRDYSSVGMDLQFDIHPLRITFPVSVGVRVSYIQETGQFVPSFLYTIDIN